jgi:hypothetical protein
MEEVRAVGDAVLDEHALRVTIDEVHPGATQLIGHDGRFPRGPSPGP